MNESDTDFNHFAGPPCLNCESEQVDTNNLYCSKECMDEYEGWPHGGED